jgi:hypothetical protein
MDPEFLKVLTRVLIVGGTIGIIGAGALLLAFRAFDAERSRGSDLRPTLLVVSLLAFVLVCCVVLLRLSVAR